MKFSVITIIILLLYFSTFSVRSQEMNREATQYITEVVIKNKNLVDFIEERVFKVADSIIEPHYPDIHYVIEFERKPWIKSYDYNVAIRAYGEPPEKSDGIYEEPINNGIKYSSYIAFIDGRVIIVNSDLDNPYIEITKKRIRIRRKIDLWIYPGIIWNIAMKGDRLLVVNLNDNSRPNIECDKSIRRDFFLLPKECIKVIGKSRKPEYIRLDSIYPPTVLSIPHNASNGRDKV